MKISDFSYPKSESRKEIIISSVLIGIFVYLFLITFQPFGTQSVVFSKLAFILIPYSVFTTLVFAIFNLYFLERQRNWTISKEILKLILIIFSCSIVSYFYNALLISKVKINFINFLFMLFYTFSIAIPLCSLYAMTRFIYLNSQNQRKAKQILQKLDLQKENNFYENSNNTINIQDYNFKEENLLFVESSDNYCTFHYMQNSKSEKILLRTTLKSVEGQIQSKKILRCHRSYIVNLEKIKNLSGNAQGYKLVIEDSNIIIPVSRKYIKLVDEILKK